MFKQKKWEITFIIMTFIMTFLVITSSDFFGKKLSLDVGQIASETVYAPFQIENEIATERKRKQSELNVPIVYKENDKIKEIGINNIGLLFDYVRTIKTTAIASQFGVSPLALLQSKSPIALYEDEYKTLLTLTEAELGTLKSKCLEVYIAIQDSGVHDANNKSAEIRQQLEATSMSGGSQKIAHEIILSQIKPNILVDEIATEEARKIARDSVESSYVLQGEMIVAQGSRITEEVYLILSKCGYIEDETSSKITQYCGLILIGLIVAWFLIKYFGNTKDLVKLKFRETALISIVYMLGLIIIRVFMDVDFVYIPVGISAMFITMLIRVDIAFILHITLVVVSSIVCKADIIFVIYMLLSGAVGILIVSTMQQRKQTMKCALMVGSMHALIFISLNLLVGISVDANLLLKGAQAFVVGLIEVILAVGSLPLWEAAFGFVTPLQLLELTNPNQPLLKRLLLEATGTYHHSLLVANLAEAAADEIGANTLLVRVGGYYHDVGKLISTNYFKENQMNENPHDYADPKTSSNIILSHVTGGIEIADAYKLPQCVKDIISQHHGTGIIQYFYAKAQNSQEDEVNIQDFQYSGPKPQSREAALIMLADVVEATVRAMQNRIGIDIELDSLVRKMVRQKLEEGQLNECQLYISDIEKIIESFTRMLKGMYHDRIEYPDKKG
ncbi:MAG: HD family phosphohydrolase [Cellulosilyticaceae bacterium]